MRGRKQGTKNGKPNPKDVQKLLIYLESHGRRKDKCIK